MTIKLAVVMDPIADIHIEKDTTFAMLLEAQRRNWSIYYIEPKDLFAVSASVKANAKLLKVKDDVKKWYSFQTEEILALTYFDIVLMRKDPPFNIEYIYATQLLELAERQGVLVVNKPQSLRDANEKLFTQWFPQCCPPSLITKDMGLLTNFISENKEIILKPLEGMGGVSIFKVTKQDPNLAVILETLTQMGKKFIIAQRYIPEITAGDKRIIMINGEPIPYVLARVPAPGETRGNLAAGASAIGKELTERDRWIAAQVGPVLKEKGLLFVGLDVIGDYLTEINITSPTGVRHLDKMFNINISAIFLDCLEKLVSN